MLGWELFLVTCSKIPTTTTTTWYSPEDWDPSWKRDGSPTARKLQIWIFRNSVPSYQYDWELHCGSMYSSSLGSCHWAMKSHDTSVSCSTHLSSGLVAVDVYLSSKGLQHQRLWSGMDVLFWRCPWCQLLTLQCTGLFCSSQQAASNVKIFTSEKIFTLDSFFLRCVRIFMHLSTLSNFLFEGVSMSWCRTWGSSHHSQLFWWSWSPLQV